jgi:hypothetical protein
VFKLNPVASQGWFCLVEFEKLEPQMLHRIQPVRKTLQNNAEKLLRFLKDLEDDLVAYADEIGCGRSVMLRNIAKIMLSTPNF